MKNLFSLTLMLGAFLAFSSFTTIEDDTETCVEYARRVSMAEMNAYYGDTWPIREWRDSQRYWEAYCDGAGGPDALLDPVFLSSGN